MEITLSKRDLDAIVQKLRIALRKDLKAMVADTRQPEMITTAEAAKLLGIQPQRMRQIADRYPHVKKGESKQGQLLFVRDAIKRMEGMKGE